MWPDNNSIQAGALETWTWEFCLRAIEMDPLVRVARNPSSGTLDPVLKKRIIRTSIQ